MIFFSSDHHYGHRNIIRYCERPFSSSEEMDKEMTRRWNAKVGLGDVVYYLGDLTLEGSRMAADMLCQLNGHVRIVSPVTHHDKRWLPHGRSWQPVYETRSGLVEFMSPYVYLQIGHQKEQTPGIALFHFPIQSWEAKHYGTWHLHGHTHQKEPSRPYQNSWALNVGVDAWNFEPVSLDEVYDEMTAHGYGESEVWVHDRERASKDSR